MANSLGLLDLYDFKSQSRGKKPLRVNKTSSSIDAISWSKNDRFIACGNADGSVVLYNTVLSVPSKPMLAQSHVKVLQQQQQMPKCLDVHFSSYTISYLVSGYEDGTVVCWDTNREVANLEFVRAHEQPCTSVVFSPFNNVLAISAGMDAKINIYDLSAKK